MGDMAPHFLPVLLPSYQVRNNTTSSWLLASLGPCNAPLQQAIILSGAGRVDKRRYGRHMTRGKGGGGHAKDYTSISKWIKAHHGEI